METVIEQSLSKPTIQFGLRPHDYLVLATVAIVGSFFISKLWLLLILLCLSLVFRSVNKSKRRYFWSSIYLFAVNSRRMSLRQTEQLPPIFED